MTTAATRAAEEIRAMVRIHESGLGTPRITIQRLKDWAKAIEDGEREHKANKEFVSGVYTESIRQLRVENDTLKADRESWFRAIS